MVIDEHFGITDTADIDAMIDQLKNGDVKKNGFILSDKTNLDKYFTDLEVLRTEIYNYAVRNGIGCSPVNLVPKPQSSRYRKSEL